MSLVGSVESLSFCRDGLAWVFKDFYSQLALKTMEICKDYNFKENKMHFLVDFYILNSFSILWCLKNAFNRAQIPSVNGEGQI